MYGKPVIKVSNNTGVAYIVLIGKVNNIARDIIEEIMGLKFNKVRPMFLKGLELDGYCKPLKLAFEIRDVNIMNIYLFSQKRRLL